MNSEITGHPGHAQGQYGGLRSGDAVDRHLNLDLLTQLSWGHHLLALWWS